MQDCELLIIVLSSEVTIWEPIELSIVELVLPSLQEPVVDIIDE
jgi:hypothetical protein